MRSHALDALDAVANPEGPARKTAAGRETARELLTDCTGAVANRFSVVGAGQDIRLQGNGSTGSALAVSENAVHPCAFRLEPGEDADHQRGGSRRIRGSRRREFRRSDNPVH